MRIARQAVSEPRLPYRYWQNRMEQALALEPEAYRTALPDRRPHLMRSAAHLAVTAGWPNQARMIRKQAEMRFPNTAGKPAWPTQETMDYCEGIRLSREDAAIAAALRTIAFSSSTATQEAWQRLGAAATTALRDRKFRTDGEMTWQPDASYYREDDLPVIRQQLVRAAMTISRRRPHWPETAELRQAAARLLDDTQR